MLGHTEGLVPASCVAHENFIAFAASEISVCLWHPKLCHLLSYTSSKSLPHQLNGDVVLCANFILGPLLVTIS